MHQSSYDAMAWLVPQIVRPPTRALDIGAALGGGPAGSYRPILEAIPGVSYTGADIAAAPNVDVVMPDPNVLPFVDECFDLVVSGQAFEHIEFPWQTIKEVSRVLVPGGAAIIIAPSSGPEHRFPKDCWRYYPDGMRALGKWAGLDCVAVWTDWIDAQRFGWGDTVAVFWKPHGSAPAFNVTPPHPQRPSSFQRIMSVARQLKRIILREWRA